MLGGDRLDVTRRRAVQGKMRDSRRKLRDELAVAGLDLLGGDRQGAADMVDYRQARRSSASTVAA